MQMHVWEDLSGELHDSVCTKYLVALATERARVSITFSLHGVHKAGEQIPQGIYSVYHRVLVRISFA